MTTKWHWLAVSLLALGLCTSVAVLAPAADDKQDTKKGDDEDAPNPVIETSTMAYKTAEFGRTHDAPEALVAAAMMLRSLKTAKLKPITEQPTDEDGKPVEDKALAAKSFDDQAEELFGAASLMAVKLNLQGFDAFIDAAKSRKMRAIVGGARLLRRRLGPGKTEVFHVKAEHNKLFEITMLASHPVHFFAEQKNQVVWANGIHKLAVVRQVPLGKPNGLTAVVIKVRNVDTKQPVEFDLLLR